MGIDVSSQGSQELGLKTQSIITYKIFLNAAVLQSVILQQIHENV